MNIVKEKSFKSIVDMGTIEMSRRIFLDEFFDKYFSRGNQDNDDDFMSNMAGGMQLGEGEENIGGLMDLLKEIN